MTTNVLAIPQKRATYKISYNKAPNPMCLIFKSNSLPEDHPEAFKAYKVYMLAASGVFFKGQANACIQSPFMGHKQHGTISGPGVYSLSDDIMFRQVGPAPYYCLDQFNPLPIPEAYKGADLDMSGFHVIPTLPDAEIYHEDVLKSRPSLIIVPVIVKKEHVRAVGTSPLFKLRKTQIEGGGMGYAMESERSVPTYIVTQIEITKEDWINVASTLESSSKSP